jgi:hypothetical protein
LLGRRSLETHAKSLSFKELEVLNDSSSYTTTAYYKNGSPNDLLKILYETKRLYEIIGDCPQCLAKLRLENKNGGVAESNQTPLTSERDEHSDIIDITR